MVNTYISFEKKHYPWGDLRNKNTPTLNYLIAFTWNDERIDKIRKGIGRLQLGTG